MFLYITRIRLYSFLTGWTTWDPYANYYPMRVIRFWCAKLLGLHWTWSRGDTLIRKIPRWMPDRY